MVKEETKTIVGSGGSGGGSGAGSWGQKGQSEEDAEKRKREMVVTNFRKDTPKNVIISGIEELTRKAEAEAEDTYTFGPFEAMGVVRFKTEEDKRKFKQWLQKNHMRTDYAEEDREGVRQLFASDNRPKADRDKRWPMGKVKRAIIEVKGAGAATDTIVEYNKGRVW